jgi:hypothetical protein
LIPVKGNIIVSVNLSQKEEAGFLKTGKNYNENFRERNPVIALVERGTEEIPTGSHIVCNYSHFDLESPLQISDNLFSIPVNEEIFAIVKEDGTLQPILGNVLVERITKETKIELPEELKKPHINRGILLTDTETIKAGQFVFWLPYSDYEICYNWYGEEKRAIKVLETEIVGYLKN